MIYKTICFILFSFSFSNVFSQEITKWGKVDDWEIEFSEVEFEKDASAVVLYESGNLLATTSEIELNVYKRIKILEKEGIKYANIEIPFYAQNNLESIQSLSAQTINVENGEIIKNKVEKSSIFKVDVNEHWKTFRFTFPNVKSGSIIEYKYTLVTKNYSNLEGWKFQSNIPKLRSDFRFDLRGDFVYSYFLIGSELVNQYKGKKDLNGEEIIRTNLKSLNSITHVFQKNDYAEQVKFELQSYGGNTFISDWNTLIDKVLHRYKTYRNKSYIKKIAQEIPDGKDEKETFKNVVDYFKNHTLWDGFYSKVPNENTKSIINSEKGNSAALNLTLSDLLNEKGFKTHLVLIRHRYSGKLVTYSNAYLGQFSTPIILVKFNENESQLIDAIELEEELDYLMPLENYNNYGLVLEKAPKEQWVSLNPPISKIYNYQNLTINKREIKFIYNELKTNYYAISDENKDENFQLEMVIDTNSTPHENYDSKQLNKQLKETKNYTLTADNYPISLSNPLSSLIHDLKIMDTERSYPVEYDKRVLIRSRVKIEITDEIQIHVPKDFNATITDKEIGLQYSQTIEQKENQYNMVYVLAIGSCYISEDKMENTINFWNSVTEKSANQLIITEK